MNETALRYEGWRVAMAGGAGVFLASLWVYSFGLFVKPLSDEFGWSREEIAAAYGVTAGMSALAAAPLGGLFDRFPPRLLIAPCLTLAACAFASMSLLTPSIWHLYAACAVFGVAGAGTSAMAYSRAISSWFERRRGMALGIVVSGGAIGALVHPPAAEFLIRLFGWRPASFIFGALVLAAGLPVVIGFVHERAAPRSDAASTTSGAVVSEGLASRVFWLQIVVLFCSAIAQNAAIVHLAPLLTDRGVPASQAAIAMSAMGAASLAGRLLTGWLLDRYFAPYVSLALLAIAALGTLLLSDAQSLAMGAVAAMCVGFGMGGESDVTPYMFSRYFGLRSFSALYGFTWTATGIGAAIGPVLMGRAFDATGSYESILVTLAAVTFGAACLLVWMPGYEAAAPRGASAAASHEPT